MNDKKKSVLEHLHKERANPQKKKYEKANKTGKILNLCYIYFLCLIYDSLLFTCMNCIEDIK